jgi:hypothetical protein
MRRFAITFGLSIAFGAGLVAITARPASAGYNVGVKYVHLDSAPAFCPPEGSALPPGFGGAIPCSGLPTNTIYVRQTETEAGYRFTGFGGDGVSSTTVPIGLQLSAGCRSGYRIHEAHISEGESWDEGMGVVPIEAFTWAHSIDVDATKSFSTHLEADADIEYIERHHASRDDWEYFGQGSSFTARGEHLVEQAVEQGTDEETARLQTRSDVVLVQYHASVTCRWTSLFHWKRHMNNPAVVPIEVVYLGIGQEPQTWRETAFPEPSGPRRDKPEPGTGQDSVGSNDVAAAPRVTQAVLTAGVDPADPCRLALSGVITTDRPMRVEYRIVDQLGVQSPVRSVEVDHTNTAYVLHHVDLPRATRPDPSGSMTATPGTRAGDHGLIAEPTDRVQGYYRLHITAPHGLWSDEANFNVEPCHAPPSVTTRLAGPTTARP